MLFSTRIFIVDAHRDPDAADLSLEVNDTVE